MHEQSRLPLTKRSKKRLYSVCAVLLIATATASAQPAVTVPTDPTGAWMVEKQLAIIRIVNCDGRLWGVVSWEKYPDVDKNNPDFAKRSRPTLGMPILLGMAQTKINQWSGDIYNSEDGRTYSASISLTAPDVLRVQGCVLGFLCGGENWTRIPSQASTDAATTPSKTPGTQRSKAPPKSGTKGPPSHAGTANSKPAAGALPISEQSDEQVCLGLVGPPGSPHEGGLK